MDVIQVFLLYQRFVYTRASLMPVSSTYVIAVRHLPILFPATTLDFFFPTNYAPRKILVDFTTRLCKKKKSLSSFLPFHATIIT